ncbi:MAG: LuxR C-terminal-related transcriptional regulator [Treponema sp.]|nr:LuxR C-terminal-related transcriptional regulator [Treponema sp.]
MKAISAKKNLFITAPGGYGKTVAARQWLSSVRGKTARMTVGDADNNPGFFCKRLASVLLEFAGSKKTIPESSISFEKLLEIIKQMPEKRARCYLVIDDLHMITNQEIIENMPTVTNRLPPYIGRCLISRSQPSAALMETGLFELITMDDLLFSPEEVEYFGAEKDCELDSKQINYLLKITGGWAMYLSALLSDCSPLDLKNMNKAPQTLTHYLNAKIWGLWDKETKVLLLRLAVPTDVNPKLAQILTGQKGGQDLLERLVKKENAFLSRTDKDTYRFHDIFREFLQERLISNLGKEEVERLNDICAQWYYEQGDFLTGGRYYIYNRDHEGVSRCLSMSNRFHEKSGRLSVETSINFVAQHVHKMPISFIQESPYLISYCLLEAFLNGKGEEYQRYMDMLYRMMPEIAEKYPEYMETVGFLSSLDFRAPLKKITKQVEATIQLLQKPKHDTGARSSTITQNLPFFHRSMRDFSEYYELKVDDLKLLRNTFGLMIGRDYNVMEHLIKAGINYERGELLNTLYHALEGFQICDEEMQSETVFSAHMMLSAVLYAIGASQEADGIMDQIADYIERKAPFLHPNYKALKTERAIRSGNMETAREWLTVYANRSNRLPFYQMFRHFCTLRAYIALGDYKTAIDFGNRLQKLAAEYNRPLDRIESGLLTAIALWHNNEKTKAVKQLKQTIILAVPYGFTQLILNEGIEVLPLLWELQGDPEKQEGSPLPKITGFVEKLMDTIYKKYDLKTAEETTLKLTAQQQSMLSYLSKGMSYNEIAEECGIGRATVKYHLLLVYKRLGVRNAKQAVIKAKALGLLE